jgi:hypothetical protein
MVDDLMDRGPRDRNRINVQEDWELKYWSHALGVSEEQLRAAVQSVGSYAKDVREYFARQGRGAKRASSMRHEQKGR